MQWHLSGFDVPVLAACPSNCERNPFSLKLLLHKSDFFFHSNGKEIKTAGPRLPCAVAWAVKQCDQISVHHCGPGKMTSQGIIIEFLSPTRSANPDEALSFRITESTGLSKPGSFSSCPYLGEGRQSREERGCRRSPLRHPGMELQGRLEPEAGDRRFQHHPAF